MKPAGAPAARGRPRDPATDRAIFDAVIAIVCEHGYDAVSVEAVAARAGVSRPTVYRRHRHRRALAHAAIGDAVRRLVPEPRPADSPGGKVLSLLDNTVTMLTRTPIGPVFRAMIPHIPGDARLGKLANELGSQRRQTLKRAIQAARAAGELPAERDLDTVLDGLIGAIYLRFFITRRRLDGAYVRKLLDTLA